MGIQVSKGGKVHSRSDRASQGVTLCGRGDNSEYRLYVVREVDCAACVRIAGGVPKLDTPEYVREYNDAWKAHQEQEPTAVERLATVVAEGNMSEAQRHESGWYERYEAAEAAARYEIATRISVLMTCCGARFASVRDTVDHVCPVADAPMDKWDGCDACRFGAQPGGDLHSATCPRRVAVSMAMVAEDASGSLRRTGARVADPERIMWRAPVCKHKRFPRRHNFRKVR